MSVSSAKINVAKINTSEIQQMYLTYAIDVMTAYLSLVEQYNADVLIQQQDLTKTTLTDTLLMRTLTANFLLDIIQKRLNIENQIDIDTTFWISGEEYKNLDTVLLRYGVTKTDNIDTLIQRLGLTDSVDIDIILKNLNITKMDSIDIIFKKLSIEITESIDILIEKLDITKTDNIDSLIQKLDLTKIDNIDTLLKKKDIVKTDRIQFLIQKLGISKIEPIDSIFDRYDITKGSFIDFIIYQLPIVRAVSGGRRQKTIMDIRVIGIDVSSPLLVKALGSIGVMVNDLGYSSLNYMILDSPLKHENREQLSVMSPLTYAVGDKSVNLSNSLIYDNRSGYINLDFIIRDKDKIDKIKQLRKYADILDL
jgi:hypothetical protein